MLILLSMIVSALSVALIIMLIRLHCHRLETDDHRQLDAENVSQSWLDDAIKSADRCALAPSVGLRLSNEGFAAESLTAKVEDHGYRYDTCVIDKFGVAGVIACSGLLAVAVCLSIMTWNVAAAVFMILLLFASVFDLKFMAIPRTAVGLLFIAGALALCESLNQAAVAIVMFAVLAASLFGLTALFKKITGKHAMGAGDIWLMSVLSAIFLTIGSGFQFLIVLIVLLLADIIVRFVLKDRQKMVAFAPILSTASIVTICMF